MSKGGGGVNIPSNYTIGLGSTSTPLQVDVDIDKIAPVTVNSNLAITQPIVSQSTSTSTSNATTNSTANVDLKLEPLSVDLKVEPLSVTSDSKSLIDLKPVVVDSCQSISVSRTWGWNSLDSQCRASLNSGCIAPGLPTRVDPMSTKAKRNTRDPMQPLAREIRVPQGDSASV